MIDTTCKTNSKERPLGFVNSVDGENNSIFNSKWKIRCVSFYFNMFGFHAWKKHMQCVSVSLSDGDGQMKNWMKESITTWIRNPKTKYIGCCYHGITLVLLGNFSKNVKKAGMIRGAIKCFMSSCGKSFTEHEMKRHWNCMVTWIERMKKIIKSRTHHTK